MKIVLVLLAVLWALPVARTQAQQAGARGAVVLFEPSSQSSEAKAEYRIAQVHWLNSFPARALQHLGRALQLDPEFGFARIVQAGLTPNLTPAERQQEFERGMANLAKAPAGEVLVAMAWKEQFAGRVQNAIPLFAAAKDFFPGDPTIAYNATLRERAGRSAGEVAVVVRRFMQEFPDDPLNYYRLGYPLFNSGDRAGGIAAFREYARRVPDQPNSHESLAELLLREGQTEEAGRLAQKVLSLDSSYTSGWAILADIKLNAGDATGARTLWANALRRALIPRDSLDMMNSIALSYLTQGDAPGALTRLGDAATLAEARRASGQSALIHQEMAVVDALYWDGKGLAGHLAKAEQIGGNTPGQNFTAAFAHAAAGHLDEARAAAGRLRAGVTDATRWMQYTADGFIALKANDPATAGAELAKADLTGVNAVIVGSLINVELLAEARMKQGKTAEAQALRASVMKSATLFPGGRTLDFFALIARQRAKQGSVS